MALIKTRYVFNRDISPGNHKFFTVPNKRIWTVCWAHVRVDTSDATGARMINMRAELEGDSIPIARTITPAIQRGNTTRRYQFFPGVSTPDSDRTHHKEVVFVAMPMYPVLMSGWTVHVEDLNEIDSDDHVSVRGFVVLEERQWP